MPVPAPGEQKTYFDSIVEQLGVRVFRWSGRKRSSSKARVKREKNLKLGRVGSIKRSAPRPSEGRQKKPNEKVIWGLGAPFVYALREMNFLERT